MDRITTFLRGPLDALMGRRPAPRIAHVSWASLAAPHAGHPTAISEAIVAECRCPTDCIRDHENE